jgi:ribosomal protein L40E
MLTKWVDLWLAWFDQFRQLVAPIDSPREPVYSACRNCGSTKLRRYEDGGHDYVEECVKCGACYGVQAEPFNIVERLNG